MNTNYLEFEWFCPQNGTPVLKGVTNKTGTKTDLNLDDRGLEVKAEVFVGR